MKTAKPRIVAKKSARALDAAGGRCYNSDCQIVLTTIIGLTNQATFAIRDKIVVFATSGGKTCPQARFASLQPSRPAKPRR